VCGIQQTETRHRKCKINEMGESTCTSVYDSKRYLCRRFLNMFKVGHWEMYAGREFHVEGPENEKLVLNMSTRGSGKM
jgi:hypothetical protein